MNESEYQQMLRETLRRRIAEPMPADMAERIEANLLSQIEAEMANECNPREDSSGTTASNPTNHEPKPVSDPDPLPMPNLASGTRPASPSPRTSWVRWVVAVGLALVALLAFLFIRNRSHNPPNILPRSPDDSGHAVVNVSLEGDPTFQWEYRWMEKAYSGTVGIGPALATGSTLHLRATLNADQEVGLVMVSPQGNTQVVRLRPDVTSRVVTHGSIPLDQSGSYCFLLWAPQSGEDWNNLQLQVSTWKKLEAPIPGGSLLVRQGQKTDARGAVVLGPQGSLERAVHDFSAWSQAIEQQGLGRILGIYAFHVTQAEKATEEDQPKRPDVPPKGPDREILPVRGIPAAKQTPERMKEYQKLYLAFLPRYRTGQWEEALKSARALADFSHREFGADHHLHAIAVSNVEATEQARKLTPEQTKLVVMAFDQHVKAEVLAAKKQYAEAIPLRTEAAKTLNQLLPKNRLAVVVRIELGKDLFQSRNFRDALVALQTAEKEHREAVTAPNPIHANVEFMLGVTQYELGNVSEAERSLRNAFGEYIESSGLVGQAPKDLWPLYQKAVPQVPESALRIAVKDWQERAKKHQQTFGTKNPTQVFFWHQVGDLYARLGEYATATQCFQRSIEAIETTDKASKDTEITMELSIVEMLLAQDRTPDAATWLGSLEKRLQPLTIKDRDSVRPLERRLLTVKARLFYQQAQFVPCRDVLQALRDDILKQPDDTSATRLPEIHADLAAALSRLGEWKAAIREYEQALARWKQNQDGGSLPALFAGVEYGWTLTEMGDYDQAIGRLEESRKVLSQRVPKGHPQLIKALYYLGQTYTRSGNIDRAQHSIQEALAQVPTDSRSRALILNASAHLAIRRGRYDHAFREAVESVRMLGKSDDLSTFEVLRCRSLLAEIFTQQQRDDLALSLYESILRVLEKQPALPPHEHRRVLVHAALVAQRQDRNDRSLQWLSEAQKLQPKQQSPHEVVQLQLLMLDAQRLAALGRIPPGNTEKIRESQRQASSALKAFAQELAPSVWDSVLGSSLRIRMVHLCLEVGEVEMARHHCEAALKRAESHPGHVHPDVIPVAYYLQGWLELMRDRPEAASQAFELAGKKMREAQSDRSLPGMNGASLFPHLNPHLYVAAIQMHRDPKNAEKAFQRVEDSLGRLTAQTLDPPRPDARNERIHILTRLIEEKIQQMAAAPTADVPPVRVQDLSELLVERSHLEDAVRAARPERKPLSLSEIQKQLDPGTALIYFVDAELPFAPEKGLHYVGIVRSKGSPEWVRLTHTANTRAALNEFLVLIRTSPQKLTIPQLVAREKQIAQLRERLYQDRVQPWMDRLQASQTNPTPVTELILTTSGFHHAVPLDALWPNAPSGCEVPSGSVYALLKDRHSNRMKDRMKEQKPTSKLFIFGEPDFSNPKPEEKSSTPTAKQKTITELNRFVPLPQLQKDGRAIIPAVKVFFPPEQTTSLTGKEASRKALTQHRESLRRADYVVWVTHGVADTNIPFGSYCLLAPSSDGNAGELGVDTFRACEVWVYPVQARCVINVTCSTELGVFSFWDGSLSFGIAQLGAGADSSVVNSWQITEQVALLVTFRFMQNIASNRPDGKEKAMSHAEALREAKHWVCSLTETDVEALLKTLRNNPKSLEKDRSFPRKENAKDSHPFQDPYFTAGIRLIGLPK